jgi:SAM-dependent MidA family methyltransferase
VSLRQIIEQEIRERGPIPFSRYMELCLYYPELGYYSRNVEQFGKAGDFYTSSDVHAVFGRLLARQFEEMWHVLGAPAQIELLELGPGRGLFARDVLEWSEKKFPEFFRALRYTLVEGSAALRRKLQVNLVRHMESGKAALAADEQKSAGRAGNQEAAKKAGTEVERGIARRLAHDVPIIVFANEFFDALPVEIISEKGQLAVDFREGRLVEVWLPASAEALEFLDRYGVHPEAGERMEVPLLSRSYMDAVAGVIGRGFLIAVDYGYTRDEQLAGRHRGTLSAYRKHSVSANVFEAPGEQDITAHVNFTALAAVAAQSGMRVEKLLTQSQFLMGIGEANQFADAFEECRLPQERAKVALQLKNLVTPAGIGESFHVMVASRGVDAGDVARLAGLSFGREREISHL